MKPINKLIIAAFAATTLIPAAVMAQATGSNQGYLIDSRGAIVKSGTGLCWHTGSWAGGTNEQCDVIQPVAALMPEPEPVVVAAAPQSQKTSFSGDALFAFDKSVLKPEGKAMLDGLVRQLDGATYESIVATGHTDRFGSDGYNQKLSERRAQSVKEYLVSQNVQAGHIDAEGLGETQPVTKAGECKGAKTAKVVACLQPDRRVDVEMKVTKTVTGSL
jgi:OOP family OmpA-OmpF porin